MLTYDIVNDSEKALRIVVEPESIEFELGPTEMVTVSASGESPAFACKQSVDSMGMACLSFWPDKGVVQITYKGNDIMELLG